MSDEPKHGERRGYGLHPGSSFGGPGFHSEEERYCAHCKRWCFLSGAPGGLYWAMMHENEECTKPPSSVSLNSPWLKKVMSQK